MSHNSDTFSHLKIALIIAGRFFGYPELFFFVIMSTFFGVISAGGHFGWQLILITSSNCLAIGLLNVIKSIKDAPSDVFISSIRTKNPIALGNISLQSMKLTTFIASMISLFFFAILGWKVSLIGLLLIIMVWFNYFGSRNINPFVEFLYKSFIMAALPFLTAFFSFQTSINKINLIPIIFLISFRMYIDSSQASKEASTGQDTFNWTTPILIPKQNQTFIFVVLALTIITSLITFVFLDIIPLWVTVLIIVIFFIYLIPQFIHAHQTKSLFQMLAPIHIPLVRSASIALLMQLLVPWLLQLF